MHLTHKGLLLFASGAILWLLSDAIAIAFLILLVVLFFVEWSKIPTPRAHWNLPPFLQLGKETQLSATIEGVQSGTATHYLPPHLGFVRDTVPFKNGLCEIPIKPKERGLYSLGPIEITSRGPLGLWGRRFVVDTLETIKVYPKCENKNGELLTKIGNERSEKQRRVYVKRPTGEFYSFRDYHPGEDIRLVDWKVSARRGSFIAKNCRDQTGHHIAVLIDCGRRMGTPINNYTRLDYALEGMIQLCHLAEKQNDTFSAIAFSNRITKTLPTASKGEIVARTLATFYGEKVSPVASDYWQVFGHALHKLSKRSLIILFTDLFDSSDSTGMRNNLARAAKKHAVLLVVMRDQEILNAITGSHNTFEKGAACHLQLQRLEALEKMRASGIHVLETTPEQFNGDVLQTYLDMRNSL